MNMQIIIVSSLFAILIVMPVNTKGQNPDSVAQVLEFDAKTNPAGDGYQYKFQTSNGISGQEQGSFVSAGNEDGNAIVQGQYVYTGPDRKQVVVTYTADENGFHPKFSL